MPINTKIFGQLSDGKSATLFEMSNANGMKLYLTDFGATVVGIVLPVHGVARDVVLGFDNAAGYEGTKLYLGATIGRYAGQIQNGAFELNGAMYHTFINDHTNTLHGGQKGFDKRLFDAAPDERHQVIRFHYVSPDGEEGFPGNLDVQVTFTLLDDNSIEIGYRCSSDMDTVLNMTNHNYYNLNGHTSGFITGHSLRINADAFLALTQDCSPNGNMLNVKDTPMDFTQSRRIGVRIAQPDQQLSISEGYDHNWIIRDYDGRVREMARLTSDNGDVELTVSSDLPGLQMYSGNYLNGQETGKSNCAYDYRGGVCLEPQFYPNALSFSHFPSPVLKKGELYNHTIRLGFRFDA